MRKAPDHMAGYDYRIPPGRVALSPARPRDAARLLVFTRSSGAVAEDRFRNLVAHMPPRSVIVLNRTKVIPARLWCRKPTGGKVQVFYLGHDRNGIRALSDSALHDGMRLDLTRGLSFTVSGKEGNIYRLDPSFPPSCLGGILERYGTTPIPPYLKKTPLTERALRTEYQTVFARVAGSVAAPTASLHFTPRLLRALSRAGHDIRFVTLHVGLGTFAPVTAGHLKAGRLHEERYSIDARTAHALSRSKRGKRPIVAVGTTVARTLESWAITRRRSGATSLFIRPGYRWRFVDALVTNFHVPKSSLMMLVASLTGRTRLLQLYRRAVRHGFRFFSFGDAMFIR